MALDFPSNPTIGQQYSGPNNIVYEWDGVKWKSANGVSPERIIEGDTLAQVTESGTTGTFEVRVDNKQRLRIIESGNASGTAALLGVGADAGSAVYLGMGDGIFSTSATLQLTSSAETKINLGDYNNAEQLSLFYNQFSDIFTISEAGTAFLTRYQGSTEINKLVANVDNSTQTDPIAVFKDTGTEVARFDNGGNLGIGEANPQSQITVVKTLDGGRGAELSLVNYGNTRGGPPQVGTETAINFGLDNSSYWGDDGNAQIKARVTGGSAASDLIFSTWNGSAFGERSRIDSVGRVTMPYQPMCYVVYTGAALPRGSQIPLVTTNGTYPGTNQGNHWSNSTYVFTCPVAGVYHASLNIKGNTAQPSQSQPNIRKNYGTVAYSYYPGGAASISILCAANDTIDFRYDHDNAGYDGASIAWASIYLLG